MNRFAVLIVGLFLGLPAGASTKPAGPFLCIVEQATGFLFNFESKSWQQTRFEAGQKYVLKRTGLKPNDPTQSKRSSTNAVWTVRDLADKPQLYYVCPDDFREDGFLYCGGEIGRHFGFNLTNHRFIMSDAFGYVEGGSPLDVRADGGRWAEGAHTPTMSIGSCTAI